jgi:hypothetical protein
MTFWRITYFACKLLDTSDESPECALRGKHPRCHHSSARVTAYPEVIPVQKSACGKLPLRTVVG